MQNSPKGAYDAIAKVYDDFTAHHDYDLWLGNLLPELARHGLREGALLDVGCGTGKSFLPMLARGWTVTGCDLSAAMLAIAKGKAPNARLLVADMRELPLLGQFDLVWALDDAVNYLLSTHALHRALRGMSANLVEGGLLVFDVNTLATYREFFAETCVVEFGDQRLIWHGEGTSDVPPGSTCQARFEDAAGKVRPHVHRQRHFPEEDIRAGLKAAGLQCCAVFGHGEDAVLKRPLLEDLHTKAIYIASLPTRSSRV